MHPTTTSPSSSLAPGELAGARPWIRRLARFGFWAFGFIHLVVGALAWRLAIGLGGETESLHSALLAIYRHPFGGTLLVALALGFLAYAAWRLVQAVWDPDGLGDRPVGLFLRAGQLVGAAIYAGLAFSAMRLVFFGGATGKEQENRQVESYTAAVLAHDWGRPALALVAGILGAVAVGNLVHAIRARFRNQFARQRMSAAMRVIVTTCGRLGYAARALVFAAATWLFARAALQSDPREAGGMAQALDELLRGPYGRWLLGLAGAGFVAYGLFGWALIRYRRLPREPDGRRQ